MRHRTLLLTFLTVLVSSLPAQTYYLPRTALQFHLLIEKQTYTPGRFARYAERYLRINGVQQQEQVTHRIINCELATIGLRDTTKCYTLKLKGKSADSPLQLAPDGVILAINPDTLRQQTFIIIHHPSNLQHQSSDITHQPSALLSREAIAATSNAKTAEIAVQQILDLRERRQQLSTGEADDMPQDEQQLRLMLSEIDRCHNALMTLFTGTVSRDTTLQTLTLCPDRDIERDVLFRLSHRLGMVDFDDLSGTPYYISIKNLYPTQPQQPEYKKEDGIFANVPSMAQVQFYQEDQLLATFEVPVAQFGYVEMRPADLFKRAPVRMYFHPATGAIVSQTTDTSE